jgi:hypothetical protein
MLHIYRDFISATFNCAEIASNLIANTIAPFSKFTSILYIICSLVLISRIIGSTPCTIIGSIFSCRAASTTSLSHISFAFSRITFTFTAKPATSFRIISKELEFGLGLELELLLLGELELRLELELEELELELEL